MLAIVGADRDPKKRKPTRHAVCFPTVGSTSTAASSRNPLRHVMDRLEFGAATLAHDLGALGLLVLFGHGQRQRQGVLVLFPPLPSGGELDLDSSAKGLAVMAVDETSEAFEKGLRAGDVITEAGQTQVLSLDDLQERIDEAKEAGRKSLLLLVRRGGDPRFVALGLDES